MTLNEKLGQELKAAMVARDANRISALRLLKSAAGYAAIERKTDVLSDSDFVNVVQKEVKKRRDAADQFEKAGRGELAAKELAEIRVLEEFLPRALSEAELEVIVREVMAQTGASSKKDMGVVIKAVQLRTGGAAEGRVISAMVGRLLP